MKKKNLLITGGAGFVGSNLAMAINARLDDYDVICFDNLRRSGAEINVERLKGSGIQFIKDDVREKNSLLELPKIDLILECSADPSVLASYEDPQYTIDTNLFGTINCLELAKRDNADFIFLSTSRVYPIGSVNEIPYEELDTRFDWKKDAKGFGFSYEGIDTAFSLLGAKSLYGATKLSSEHIISEYLDMYSFRGVINRFGVIAGPWQMGKIDQGIVGFWVAKHKFEGDLGYLGYGGKGKQVRDVLHIDDAVELILFEIDNLDRVNKKIYNVGGGRKGSVSLCELTEIVQNITGAKINIGPVESARKADIRIYITDNSVVTEETGWMPKKDIANIVSDVDKWIDDNKTELKNIIL